MSAVTTPYSAAGSRITWRVAAAGAAAVFMLALPVAIITTNVRLLFGARPLYVYAVDTYDAPAVTGIPRPELVRGVDDLRAYLFDDRERLSLQVTNAQGQQEPLFNEREVLHMRDVKHLLRGFFTAQVIALALIGAYAVPCLILHQRGGLLHLLRLTWYAMLGFLACGIAFGVVAAIDFDALFTQFHLISFSNDLWLLDPRTDHLLQLFPDPFWHLASSLLIGGILAQVLIIAAAATLGRRWLERRGRPLAPADPDGSARA